MEDNKEQPPQGRASPAAEDLIGDRIKAKRQRLGMNFEQLARLCKDYDEPTKEGISPTSLLRYESGKFKPGARELRILCAALDVSANWLLLGEGDGDSGRLVPITFDEGMDVLKSLVFERFYEHNFMRKPGWDINRDDRIARAKSQAD
jgi:transcriptional regulator with XRE-family HTH domain